MLLVGALSGCKHRDEKKDIETAWSTATAWANSAYWPWTRVQASGDACPSLEQLHEYDPQLDLKDPWGHEYRIACGEKRPPEIKQGIGVYSLGADGEEGTADDVKNWELRPEWR